MDQKLKGIPQRLGINVMTTRRNHACNLCHSNVPNETAGVGLVWQAADKIRFTTPGQAETHICQECLTNLEATLDDMRTEERRRQEIAATNSTD